MSNKNLRLLYIMNKLACNMCLGTKKQIDEMTMKQKKLIGQY